MGFGRIRPSGYGVSRPAARVIKNKPVQMATAPMASPFSSPLCEEHFCDFQRRALGVRVRRLRHEPREEGLRLCRVSCTVCRSRCPEKRPETARFHFQRGLERTTSLRVDRLERADLMRPWRQRRATKVSSPSPEPTGSPGHPPWTRSIASLRAGFANLGLRAGGRHFHATANRSRYVRGAIPTCRANAARRCSSLVNPQRRATSSIRSSVSSSARRAASTRMLSTVRAGLRLRVSL